MPFQAVRSVQGAPPDHRRGGPRLRRTARRLRRPSGRGSGRAARPPAPLLLRRRGLAAVRGDLRPARVLPDPDRGPILRDHADAMVAGWAADPVMVELGSGSSSKTRRLIAAALRAYGGCITCRSTSRGRSSRSRPSAGPAFPRLRVTGYAANYRDALAGVVERFDRPKLFVFLGSSLGNYERRRRRAARDARPGDGPGRPAPARDRPGQGPGRSSKPPTTTPRG